MFVVSDITDFNYAGSQLIGTFPWTIENIIPQKIIVFEYSPSNIKSLFIFSSDVFFLLFIEHSQMYIDHLLHAGQVLFSK